MSSEWEEPMVQRSLAVTRLQQHVGLEHTSQNGAEFDRVYYNMSVQLPFGFYTRHLRQYAIGNQLKHSTSAKRYSVHIADVMASC